MSTVYVLLFCVAVSAAITVLFFVILAVGARRRNARAHRLGRLLKLSHPEWN